MLKHEFAIKNRRQAREALAQARLFGAWTGRWYRVETVPGFPFTRYRLVDRFSRIR